MFIFRENQDFKVFDFEKYTYKNIETGMGTANIAVHFHNKEGVLTMEDQKQRVYDALNKLGIKYEVVEHEPVHTMEDMDRLGLPEKGTLCKNLFLRDSKGKRHFLVTCDEKKKVDLKSLGRALGGGNLSFASEDRLEQYLGLKQGSVSPFGLMNDTDHAVEFFIDKDLSRCKSLGIHPLENTATVFLSFKDLDKFLWNLDVDAMKIKL